MLIISHIRSNEVISVNASDINNLLNTKQSEAQNITTLDFRNKYENSFLLVMIYLCMTDCAYYLAKQSYFSGKNKHKLTSLLNTKHVLDNIYNVIKLQEKDETDINIFTNISFDANMKTKIIQIIDKLYKQIFSSIVNDETMMTSRFVNNEILMYDFLKEKENQDSQINKYITSFYKNYGFKFTSSDSKIKANLSDYFKTANLSELPDVPYTLQFVSKSAIKDQFNLLDILCQSLNVDVDMMKNTLKTQYSKVLAQPNIDNKLSYSFMKTGTPMINNYMTLNNNSQKHVNVGGTRKKNQRKKQNTKKAFMKGGVWTTAAIIAAVKAGQIIYATAEAVALAAPALAAKGLVLTPATYTITGAAQYVATSIAVTTTTTSMAAPVLLTGAAVALGSIAYNYYNSGVKEKIEDVQNNNHDDEIDEETTEHSNVKNKKKNATKQSLSIDIEQIDLEDEEQLRLENEEQRRLEIEEKLKNEEQIRLENEQQRQKNIENNVMIPEYTSENKNIISDEPENWTEKQLQDGTTYWYNKNTDESVYEKPQSLINDKLGQRSTQINNKWDRIERKNEFYDKNPEYWKEVKNLFQGETHNTGVDGVSHWYNYMSGNIVYEKPVALMRYEELDNNPENWGEITAYDGEKYWRNYKTRHILFEKPDMVRNWENKNVELIAADKLERQTRTNVFRNEQYERDVQEKLKNEEDNPLIKNPYPGYNTPYGATMPAVPKDDGRVNVKDFNDLEEEQSFKPIRGDPIIIGDVIIGGLAIYLLFNYLFGKKNTYIPDTFVEKQILHDLNDDLENEITNIEKLLTIIYPNINAEAALDLNTISDENDKTNILYFYNKYCKEKHISGNTIPSSSLICLQEILNVLKTSYSKSKEECNKGLVMIEDILGFEIKYYMPDERAREKINVETYSLLSHVHNLSIIDKNVLLQINAAATTFNEEVSKYIKYEGDESALYVVADDINDAVMNDDAMNDNNNQLRIHYLYNEPPVHNNNNNEKLVEITNKDYTGDTFGGKRKTYRKSKHGGKIKASRKSKHGGKIKASRKSKDGSKRKTSRKYKK